MPRVLCSIVRLLPLLYPLDTTISSVCPFLRVLLSGEVEKQAYEVHRPDRAWLIGGVESVQHRLGHTALRSLADKEVALYIRR